MDGVLLLGETLMGPAFEQLILLAEVAKDTTGHGASGASTVSPWIMLLIAAVLVALNGFFVAAEFALVKIRVSQVAETVVAEIRIWRRWGFLIPVRLRYPTLWIPER